MSVHGMPPDPGFGEFDVAEMPAYVQSYSRRGNAATAEVTPVFQQARFGNKRNRGGMGAYLSNAENDGHLEGQRQKRGLHGVFEATRWAPGMDWSGNFGTASLSEVKNYAGIPTRGGALRKGGPRRSDVVDRLGFWFETARPGIANSRFTQTNDNYSGIRDPKKKAAPIIMEADTGVLRQMIEHNPFHIASHSALQARALYQTGDGGNEGRAVQEYPTNYSRNELHEMHRRAAGHPYTVRADPGADLQGWPRDHAPRVSELGLGALSY